MSLRLRRGTDADRQSGIIFDPGELVYTTDTKKLYIGDGVANGGNHVLKTSAGVGLVWDDSTQTLNIGAANLSTGYISEDSTHLYFTPERAQDAVAGLFTHSTHSGITYAYNDVDNIITSTVTVNIESDTSPSLGANLDLNSHNITGTGNINIDGSYTNTALTLSASVFTTGDNGLTVNSTRSRVLDLVTLSSQNSIQGISHLAISASNGTLGSPTPLASDDHIGGLLFRGYNSSASWTVTSGIYSKLSDSADIDTQFPSSIVNIFTGTNSSSMNTFSFTEKGVLSAPILKTASYATSNYPSTPEAGWIIYDSTLNQFIGYAGSTRGWIVLG
jgi:hypothetical protein